MSNTKELSKAAYEFEAKMPLAQALPLGLQHVLAMFVGNLTPLLIITGACGMGGGSEFAGLQVSLLQNAMLVAGVCHWSGRRQGPYYYGNQFRIYRRVQQCGGYHGRRGPCLWGNDGGVHYRRSV